MTESTAESGAQFPVECIDIREFVRSELMHDPADRFVWDLGCGAGGFSFAMGMLGARKVLGSDLAIPPGVEDKGPVVFARGGVEAAKHVAGTLKEIDTVFMHLMSEHVMDFPGLMAQMHQELRPGAEILVHHDNYFSPTGSHDHGLVAFDATIWAARTQGPKCWDAAEKCSASDARRAVLRQHWPELWNELSEATADPSDCTRCNYFRRSQPWAHLIYGDTLQLTFPEPFFKTALNRLTPSQVIWYALQAGFAVDKQSRVYIGNEPTEALALEFGRHCLQTFTLTLRLIRI